MTNYSLTARRLNIMVVAARDADEGNFDCHKLGMPSLQWVRERVI